MNDAALLLRPWRENDVAALREAIDEDVEHIRPWLTWSLEEPATAAQTHARLRRHIDAFDRGEAFRYAIARAAEPTKILGGANLYPLPAQNAFGLGYWLRRSAAGRGIAAAAVAALVVRGFDEGRGDVAFIECDVANDASAAFATRLGFAPVAPVTRTYPDGSPRALLRFERSRELFQRHERHLRERAAAVCAIATEPIGRLADVAHIPIAFSVTSVLDVQLDADGLGGVRLVERDVENPWTKDYDAESGGGPATWLERFDVTRWGLITARAAGGRIGSAVVAWNTPGVDMLKGRDDLAVLWDLRVAPAARGRGVGAALVDAVEAWARERGCIDLEVETQNINVPACRFYARQGFRLAALDRFAYPDLPEETQLLWHKRLRS